MTVSKSLGRHLRRPAKPGKPPTAEDLLTWYDTNRRTLAWRAKPGAPTNPYRIWLSEIMLQQTTVQAVDRYYRDFLRRWPTVTALARASLDEVLSAWAGLGYYSRARNLHRTARIVAEESGGRFPRTAAELKKLPGIGEYTSAAIASIAFGERVAAIDANGERVLARLFALEEPLPKIRKRMAALADALVPAERPGDFAQALMDLGSMVCTLKRPACAACPLAANCLAKRLGIAEKLPVKASEVARPTRRGAAFVAIDRKGAVLLERRPENGLLGGMLQPPLGPWRDRFPEAGDALGEAPFAGHWIKAPNFVRHSFTHFHLEVEVYVARFARRPTYDGEWVAREDLSRSALPTAMKKLVHHALDNEDTIGD
jgi:A/G-specific adenine glycosylase